MLIGWDESKGSEHLAKIYLECGKIITERDNLLKANKSVLNRLKTIKELPGVPNWLRTPLQIMIEDLIIQR